MKVALLIVLLAPIQDCACHVVRQLILGILILSVDAVFLLLVTMIIMLLLQFHVLQVVKVVNLHLYACNVLTVTSLQTQVNVFNLVQLGSSSQQTQTNV